MNDVLPIIALRRIDAACDDFEEAWRDGRQPRIEDFLLQCGDAERPRLLESLKQLEQELVREQMANAAEPAAPPPVQQDAIRGKVATFQRDVIEQVPFRNGPQVVLKVIAGAHQGQEFAYEGHATLLVGRSPVAQLQLQDDPYFSRHHFRLEFNPPACYLLDLNSRNGTFVNDERVTGQFLNDGDVILGGLTKMAVAIRMPSPTGGGAEFSPCRPLSATFPQDGEVRIAGYEIHEQIGAGDLGIVFRATRLATGEACALKVITAGAQAGDDSIRMFLREASVLKQLCHPGIVRSIETGVSGTNLYFSSELVSTTPWQMLAADWPATQRIRGACAVIGQILDALEHAHSLEIIHRDVKPGNILIAQSNAGLVAKLADFGLARHHAAAGMSRITREGDAIGGLPFMSPEQFVDSRAAKPECDIYSAAATLYWMITGEGPIVLENHACKFLAILEDAPIPLRERCPEVPEPLAGVIHRALDKSSDKRFLSAAEMRQQLHEFGE